MLRLQAGGLDEWLTVSANGAFSFAAPLDHGASYVVTVANHPARHTCRLAVSGEGTIEHADVTDVVISCTGPAGTIAISGRWGWTFDPSQDTQIFRGSLLVQDVALTISGDSLDSARVGGTAVTLGEATAPIALPLGSTVVPVGLTASGGLSKTYQLVFDRGGVVLDKIVYGKASNTATGASLGNSIALSGDTLVVGAFNETSNATGIDGDQADRSALSAGAVYVFVRDGATWMQQAYIKASNTGVADSFGYSVALSGDTLAVGAIGESGGLPGVDPIGGQADNSCTSAGAVYVYVRHGTTWSQQAYIKASNPRRYDNFGTSVALFGDTLAVGAIDESSSATGIDGDQTDGGAVNSGAVYLFVRSGATWSQQAYIKASNTGAFDEFGNSVALSGDTLVVGAPNESSKATGVDGDQADNSALAAGAAYVFVRAGTSWSQQAYLKASNTYKGSRFGYAVALSEDTVVAGAINESSRANGVDPVTGATDYDFGSSKGAAYVFVRHGATWAHQAFIKAPNALSTSFFGASVAVSGDSLAVGTLANEFDPTRGVGDQNTGSPVYLLVRRGATWSHQTSVRVANAESPGVSGLAVALARDTLVVGITGDANAATGINPVNGQLDNSARKSGAFHVFR